MEKSSYLQLKAFVMTALVSGLVLNGLTACSKGFQLGQEQGGKKPTVLAPAASGVATEAAKNAGVKVSWNETFPPDGGNYDNGTTVTSTITVNDQYIQIASWHQKQGDGSLEFDYKVYHVGDKTIEVESECRDAECRDYVMSIVASSGNKTVFQQLYFIDTQGVKSTISSARLPGSFLSIAEFSSLVKSYLSEGTFDP